MKDSPVPTPSILDRLGLSEPQQLAATARGADVAVTAGAGTGKTRTLVARFLALLEEGVPLRQIAAMTFTRKAAREMRSRVRQEIEAFLQEEGGGREPERWRALQNQLDAARIGTIHNICGEILRAHPAEAALDPEFQILDEAEAARLQREALELALAELADDEAAGALLFARFGAYRLADFGRTLLALRLDLRPFLADPAAGPEEILTRWRAALGQLQTAEIGRLNEPPLVDALAVLRRARPLDEGDRMAVQRQLALQAVADLEQESPAGRIRNLAALGEIKLQGGSQKKWAGGGEELAAVKDALSALREWYKGTPVLQGDLGPNDEGLAELLPAALAFFTRLDQSYAALKRQIDGLDFDDLEQQALDLLERHPEAAGRWQSEIAALLVDEFQDTNGRQLRLIRRLCPEAGKLFVVGDAKQSIYRFRGADVTVFLQEQRRIEGAGGRLLDLDTSYRAHAGLLAGHNGLLGPVFDTGRPLEDWDAPFAPLRPGGKKLAEGLLPPFVEFHLAPGSKDEALPRAAAALVRRLAALRERGVPFHDMAILCRASSAFAAYEDACDRAGVPYVTVAGGGFLERPEIRDLLNALRAILDPHDDLALTGFLRSPGIGLSDVDLLRLHAGRGGGSLWAAVRAGESGLAPEEAGRLGRAVELLAELHRATGREPAAALLQRFLDRTHYRAALHRGGETRALRNVDKLVQEMLAGGHADAAAFLEQIDLWRQSGGRMGEARAAAGGAVQIMTVHAAKGLEFPVVALGDAGYDARFTPGLLIDPELGLLFHPPDPAGEEESERPLVFELALAVEKRRVEAENRRLLYVAATRAEQMLLVSGHCLGGREERLKLSTRGWLKQLLAGVGLDGEVVEPFDENGGGIHELAAAIDGVGVLAAVYEPGALAALPPLLTEAPSAPSLEPPRLIGSLLPEPGPAAAEETPERVWRIVPERGRPAPAWVIGSLVHAALAAWRFPDDDGGEALEGWLRPRAGRYGLIDAGQIDRALGEAARLLRRFRESDLYAEMAAAEVRRHEVQFSRTTAEGQIQHGVIDALYRHEGAWWLVDFKTDRFASEAALAGLLAEKDYEEQVRGYGRALQALQGIGARLRLCFLNGPEGVVVRGVSTDWTNLEDWSNL